MAEILAFLNAIPYLWKVWKSAEKALGPNWGQKLLDLTEAYGKVRNASSKEELNEAAKLVHDAWTK